jgi:hypothetical protein
MSTFNAPSNHKLAVNDEITYAINLFRFVCVGLSISRFFLQISYIASLSSIIATSVCSNNECVDNIELYGSTTAVDIVAILN